MIYLLLSLLLLPAFGAESFSTDDLWSRLGQNCTANAFLKRNNANTGWECSNLPDAKISVGSTAISSSGFTSTGVVVFSSNVVIEGELRVNSTKSKAIFLPVGGIHLDDGSPTASVAPGQMFAKKIVTSTITLKGSAILFEDSSGVVKATMTANQLEIEGVNAGKLKNNFKGAGAPPSTDCDEAKEEGIQYYSRSPSRIYFCVDNGSGGFGWGHTNINPP